MDEASGNLSATSTAPRPRTQKQPREVRFEAWRGLAAPAAPVATAVLIFAASPPAMGQVSPADASTSTNSRADGEAPRSTLPPPEGAQRTAAEAARFAQDLEKAPPPPSHVVYFQYGVAFTTEQILAPGPICDSTGAPCILGAGGGIVARGGWRSTGPLYIGLAYELTKQDPNKLYRIALLQQARAEARYYFMTARVTEPYLSASAGVAGYGNQWSIDTWGPGGSLGAGVEYQITRRTVVGLGVGYRLIYLSRFTDTAGTDRVAGIAQLFGFDLVLEQRDAIVTDGADQARLR